MPQVIFSHPNHPDPTPLSIDTGANEIRWGYGLNTQTYPTYGGEVVQILSAYTDNLRIGGDIKDYTQAEHIYKWFIQYFAIASQGVGSPSFIETPVTFAYPRRGWTLKVQPLSLPQFAYGTEIVAPQWQMQANVVETDPRMDAFTLERATISGFNFDEIHAGIGYDDQNPFSDPAANPDIKTSTNKSDSGKFDPMPHLNQIADFYNSLLQSYLGGDFDPNSYQYLFSKPNELTQSPTLNKTESKSGAGNTSFSTEQSSSTR